MSIFFSVSLIFITMFFTNNCLLGIKDVIMYYGVPIKITFQIYKLFFSIMYQKIVKDDLANFVVV
jgi:hypothetical protein